MSDAVVVEAVRTPAGRRHGGLAGFDPGELLRWVQLAALERADIDPSCVDRVIAGADLPSGSALLAAGVLAHQITAGTVDVGIACGVTEMRSTGPREVSGAECRAGDRLAAHWGVSRAECDHLGVESRRRACHAWKEGWFDEEVVAVAGLSAEGDGRAPDRIPLLTRDEGVYAMSLDALAALPTILPDGVHTAATCSPAADQGSAVVIARAGLADDLGLSRALIVDCCLARGDPALPLGGPIDVTRRLLERNRLSAHDVDVFEVNEVFASVVLAWTREFSIELDRVNPSGGAIALGDPGGSAGTRLLTTAVHELERVDGEWGVITMSGLRSIGIGMLLRRL